MFQSTRHVLLISSTHSFSRVHIAYNYVGIDHVIDLPILLYILSGTGILQLGFHICFKRDHSDSLLIILELSHIVWFIDRHVLRMDFQVKLSV